MRLNGYHMNVVFKVVFCFIIIIIILIQKVMLNKSRKCLPYEFYRYKRVYLVNLLPDYHSWFCVFMTLKRSIDVNNATKSVWFRKERKDEFLFHTNFQFILMSNWNFLKNNIHLWCFLSKIILRYTFGVCFTGHL